jgi:uncharacterized membrane protein
MINPAVFTTTFLAAAVEIIEMVIIVVGVGAIRGWRSTLLGTGAGLAVVAALILALGAALTHVPISLLRVVADSLLFVFGPQCARSVVERLDEAEHCSMSGATANRLATSYASRCITWASTDSAVACW